jgi:hypothetical protein
MFAQWGQGYSVLFAFFERASPQSRLEGQKRVVLEMEGKLLIWRGSEP